MADVFIDGSSGTTGLRIRERLSGRQDIRLLQLSEEKRHDVSARTEAISRADVAFLCLPDAAAAEIAEAARDCASVIIDTSTVHRTEEGWTYGFPELDGQRERIASSKRIANPGCHAGGFIALVRPLVFYGLISEDIRLQCTSLTGYSGGGKKMIADYSDAYDNRTAASSADGGAPRGEGFGRLQAPRLYGLGGGHKHLPEMTKVCGLRGVLRERRPGPGCRHRRRGRRRRNALGGVDAREGHNGGVGRGRKGPDTPRVEV